MYRRAERAERAGSRIFFWVKEVL
jgi:hypothetical protein